MVTLCSLFEVICETNTVPAVYNAIRIDIYAALNNEVASLILTNLRGCFSYLLCNCYYKWINYFHIKALFFNFQ